MSENLETIRRIIEAHQNISGRIKLLGESVNDLEALLSLHKAYSSLSQSSVETLVQKQQKLQQTVSFLNDGLRNHFSVEEQVFPPLFGELLMRALLIEHREIRRQLDEAKSAVSSGKAELMSQVELLADKSRIQNLIIGICQTVENHASREEVILNMIKRALEEEEQGEGG